MAAREIVSGPFCLMMEEGAGKVEPEPEFNLEMLEATGDLTAPKRGELRTGRVVAVDEQGLIVDLGLKRDGVVPRGDLEKLAAEGVTFQPGQDVPVMILSPEDQEGNLVVSVYQARHSQDWLTAQQFLASGEIFEAEVAGYNRGGLIVPFGDLRAFVPASHIADIPRGMSESARQNRLVALVGKKYPFKVIEVDQARRRLVISHRDAQREWRELQKAHLLAELREGQVHKGTVSGLRDFGAFVDLGGADGLIHISELSWRRLKHPREVLKIGDEVEVLVVRLDRKDNRIALSLKQLQPDPWQQIQERFTVGQPLQGAVTRVTSFGAFVDLGEGIEGLLHSSRLGDELSALHEGRSINVQIVNIDPDRQRIGLALHHAESSDEGDEEHPQDPGAAGAEEKEEGREA